MNATELRIGNLLQRLDGSYFTVRISDLEIIESLPEYIQPQPVVCSTELLKQLNFIKTSERYEEWGLPKFCIEEFNDGWYFTGGEGCKFGARFIYVHQLQNLYFAMIHEELDLSKLKIENY